jgi:uncharacterized membrane-anchored protein YhcB (DUF1043 family)
MKARQHGIILFSLAGIGLLCGLAGGSVGYRLGRQAMQERADPEAWHERASRRFEEVVRPTPEQSARLETHLHAALEDLKRIRSDALNRSAEVIDRLVERVEAELTPAQKEAFDRIKPRRDELMEDVMKDGVRDRDRGG